MNKASHHSLQIKLWLIYRWAYRRRGSFLRFLLCWSIGILALSADEKGQFDLRFQVRGDQSYSHEVVLIHIDPAEVSGLFPPSIPFLRPSNSSSDLTDSYYWSKRAWHQLLSQILNQNPKAVGVTLFFGNNIGEVSLKENEKKVFTDPRIVWSSRLDSMGLPQDPHFAVSYLYNSGILNYSPDPDGIVRKYFPFPGEVPHFITLLTERAGYPPSYLEEAPAPKIINYRGRGGLFPTYSLADIILKRVPPSAFTNKIVIIGGDPQGAHQTLTPLGSMSRAELSANLVDNVIYNRWLNTLPEPSYELFLLLMTILFVSFIYKYPQPVALVLCLWGALLLAALSAWVFDNFYLWLPAVSPIILLAGTWVIFVGYRANIVERRNWQLQQERNYLNQLEQMKNNFVSLISHDLKTPIARIQAVADRLNQEHPDGPMVNDLKSIRKASDELHRYIQSILGVMRVESRDFKLNREIADINELIEQAYYQLVELADEKNIEIERQLEPMFSSEFDVTLIKEVVVNLLENAIKYTPPGGSVVIRSSEVEGFIKVEVSDTGEGVPEEELELVWQKFSRGRDQDLRSKGTGLGLYLVKYFVELHGGEVSMTSKLGQGTSVNFTLPLDEA